jgi:acetyltransferase-like isoleucine patch superfamily enzyme
MRLSSKLLVMASMFLPWGLRRMLLQYFAGYKIHPTCRIGLSLIFPDELIMEKGARIGHFNVCKGVRKLHLRAHSAISSLNWITGFPISASRHFAHQPERMPQLIMGEHSAIASRHLIDCTATVTIGKFTTIGGFYSQILTHSIDLAASRQSCSPIEIGAYCFLSTNCVLLGGSALPDYSVLGAKSLLNKHWTEPYQLYGGMPAKPIKKLAEGMSYFCRETGFVW